jgi:predicted phage terminase large subunit-like protein
MATREEMIKKMATDEEYFLRNALPAHFPWPLEPFHREMLKDIEARDQNGHPLNDKCAFKCPRKHGKTTLLSLGHPLYKIAFRKTRFMLIVADTYDQACLNLENIKDVIEYDERWKYFFGELKSPTKWNEGEIELTSGIKIMAKGTGQRIRGLKWGPFRPDMIVVDDFESEHNTDTKEQRAKVRRWIMGAMLPSVADVFQVIMSGTIVHDKAFLAQIDSNPHWRTRHYAILKQDGTPLWPRKFPMAKIKSLEAEYRHEGQLDDYRREFFNDPRNPDSTHLLEPGMAQFYDPKRLFKKWNSFWLKGENGKHPVPLDIYAGIDPALGRETSDDTAIMTIGVSPENDVYILNTTADKLGPYETSERFLVLYKMMKPLLTGIEDVAYQSALKEIIEREAFAQGLFPALEGVPTKGERKSARIMSMEPRFKSGRIFFRDGNDQDAKLIDQAERFDPEKKDNDDDMLDALYVALKLAMPARRVEFKDGEPSVHSNPLDNHWAVL